MEKTQLTDLEADLRLHPSTWIECWGILFHSADRGDATMLDVFEHLYDEDGDHNQSGAQTARALGVTRQRVNQVRAKLLRRLRHELTH